MVMPNSVCHLASGQVGFSDCQLSISGVFHYDQSSDKRWKNNFCVSLLEMDLGFFFYSISFIPSLFVF